MRASLLLVSLLSGADVCAQDFSALDAATGQALFERNWIAAPASTASADGLGPYYTARSCAACHPGGGSNSELSALSFLLDDPVYGELLQSHAITGLEAEAVVDVVSPTPFAPVAFADGEEVVLYGVAVRFGSQKYGPFSRSARLRRPPSLRGLALLEQVSLEQLQALADPDDQDGDGISGRVAEGRFGWKARTTTLRAQVARSLSLDLGLGSSLFPANAGDCTPQQTECMQAATQTTGDPLEAPDAVLNLLLAYLQALPPPVPNAEADETALFTELGCAACHLPQLDAGGQQLHPYTDLLLHDMGAELGDAPDSPIAAEWRTAPLWGLGQTTRFLHDGRAATLQEAILWHGGEASGSAAAYRNLNEAQRQRLHQWLLGL